MLIHALLYALSYSYLKTEKKKKVNLIQNPDVAHSVWEYSITVTKKASSATKQL